MMMAEVPEGQGVLVQIRDQMLVDAAAPDTPTSTARAGPTISPGWFGAARSEKEEGESGGSEQDGESSSDGSSSSSCSRSIC